ncbi:unnamed protein product [Notodromas monacha]|uniref:EF-hand domain-containing protein n=1 Tax=Notodromas monacha TaxID=399045 RepID=A0A7R9G9B2_9CRUS|nr:unnamed protein product [Notodromas monacha]CAG0914047.1 unnamed protein product [Notodromas monacha]
MECLEKIWSTLGVGENGYLNKPELLRLCQHVGVLASEEDISELFDGLNVNADGRVSFQELVQLFHESKDEPRNDEALPSSPPETSFMNRTRLMNDSGFSLSSDGSLGSVSCRKLDAIFSELDPFSTGLVTWDALSRWWEDKGIEDADSLLRTLGFSPSDARPVNNLHQNGAVGRAPHLKSLATWKGRSMSIGSQNEMISLSTVSIVLEEFSNSFPSKKVPDDILPLVAVLIAQKDYSRVLKADLEAATRQIEKVRLDLSAADARAAALAQEIDDQNARMEKMEKERMMELEEEYGEKLRHLRKELDESRYEAAKETTASEELSSLLEQTKMEKLKLDEKILALKEELIMWKDAGDDLRTALNEKTEETSQLLNQFKLFEQAQQEEKRRTEEDREAASKVSQELSSLKDEVARLREANRRLQDENDVLSQQPRNGSVDSRQRWPDIMSGIVELPASCSSTSSPASPAASPAKKRVVRAKSFNGSSRVKRRPTVCRAPSLSQELCMDSMEATPTPPASEADEEMDSSTSQVTVDGLSVSTGEKKITGILSRLEHVMHELQSCSSEDPRVADHENCVSPRNPCPARDASEMTDVTSKELDAQLSRITEAEQRVAGLNEVNGDLSSKLEFLRVEYEDSEEYWQQKMEEERQYYEDHINKLSEKLNSLLLEFHTKLAEYEEAAAGQKTVSEEKTKRCEESLQQSSLPTIVETDYEIQVMEAEAEAKHWKALCTERESEKNKIVRQVSAVMRSLSNEWVTLLARTYADVERRVEALTRQVSPLCESASRVQTAAISWKMRAWEAEGLVHDLETDRVVAEDEKRAMADELRERPAADEVQRLAVKLWREENKARHLEASLRQQQDHAGKIIHGKRLTWRDHLVAMFRLFVALSRFCCTRILGCVFPCFRFKS